MNYEQCNRNFFRFARKELSIILYLCKNITQVKILFLVYHGFSEHSGISKKIHYQVKGLREIGHDVRLCYYGFAENGHR